MNKKIKVFTSAFLLLGLSTITLVNKEPAKALDNQSYSMEQFKNDQRELTNNSDADNDFIEIDDETYTEEEFDQFKQTSDLIDNRNGEDKSDNVQLEKDFIKEKVIFNKAKEVGISISSDEVKQFAELSKQNFDNSTDQASKDFIKGYIKALGLSEKEYWDSYALKGYEYALTIGQLKDKVIQNLDIEKTNPDYLLMTELEWNKYVDELIKESDVSKVK